MKVLIYRRTGFRPCCIRHVEYQPCKCPRWGFDFYDDDNNKLELADDIRPSDLTGPDYPESL